MECWDTTCVGPGWKLFGCWDTKCWGGHDTNCLVVKIKKSLGLLQYNLMVSQDTDFRGVLIKTVGVSEYKLLRCWDTKYWVFRVPTVRVLGNKQY